MISLSPFIIIVVDFLLFFFVNIIQYFTVHASFYVCFSFIFRFICHRFVALLLFFVDVSLPGPSQTSGASQNLSLFTKCTYAFIAIPLIAAFVFFYYYYYYFCDAINSRRVIDSRCQELTNH